MRRVVFRSVVVVTVGAAVLIGVLYVASTVDARAPEVIGFELTQPLSGDPDTALSTTSVEIVFNEPVRVDAGSEPMAIDPHVDGAVSWSGSTMIFTPHERLALDTEYVVSVGTGIRDLSGNPIGDSPPSFTFMTAGRPTVAETAPADGAIDVPLASPIRIEFSTLMDTGAVEGALSISPAVELELDWSGEVLEIVPIGGLQPATDYELTLAGDAADVAGVPLDEPVSVAFRTVAAGLDPVQAIPADGVDGISPATAIAVAFDRSIDPESVDSDQLRIEPDVAGTLEVVSARSGGVVSSGDEADAAGASMLRFTPSGPLPLNTTFEVTLEPGVQSTDGGGLAEPVSWTFTTGAPAATLSNQIAFISERSGVANVWAMNADGSAQHQVSAELTPVTDYAVAPDGSRVVIADGRGLVLIRADGSGRTALTDEGFVEFDPAFAPNGQRFVFGRADAESGEGLGLWMQPLEGGDATAVEPPPELDADATPTPSPSAEEGTPGWLRAPRFSPDGQALAYLGHDEDGGGFIAILELPDERVTRTDVSWSGAPAWMPDSSAVLVTAHAPPAIIEPPERGERVLPVLPDPTAGTTTWLLNRSGLQLIPAPWERGRLLAVRADGAVAYADPDGELRVTRVRVDDPGERVAALDGARVLAASFAPGEQQIVVVVAPRRDEESAYGTLTLVDLETGERTALVRDGSRPRWLP